MADEKKRRIEQEEARLEEEKLKEEERQKIKEERRRRREEKRRQKRLARQREKVRDWSSSQFLKNVLGTKTHEPANWAGGAQTSSHSASTWSRSNVDLSLWKDEDRRRVCRGQNAWAWNWASTKTRGWKATSRRGKEINGATGCNGGETETARRKVCFRW